MYILIHGAAIMLTKNTKRHCIHMCVPPNPPLPLKHPFIPFAI